MDPDVIRQHFRDLKRAGVSTVSVSWWGQAHKEGSTDNQGVSTDRAVALLLSLADETNGAVSVCFHLEPYPGRSAASVLEDLEYIHERYGHHQSLARRQQDRRVIFYVYDSYHIPPKDWAEIFTDSGAIEIVLLMTLSELAVNICSLGL
jgi:glycoprotein endo-alpha-1,2-mannosidase